MRKAVPAILAMSTACKLTLLIALLAAFSSSAVKGNRSEVSVS